MPRLPTMRVIGSHAISTRSVLAPPVVSVDALSAVVVMRSPRLLVAGGQVGAALAPLRLLVERLGCVPAEGTNDGAVHAAGGCGDAGARRLVHERHELVREAGHRAGDSDATGGRTTAHTVAPAVLGYVAFDHWSPAAQLHQALG